MGVPVAAAFDMYWGQAAAELVVGMDCLVC